MKDAEKLLNNMNSPKQIQNNVPLKAMHNPSNNTGAFKAATGQPADMFVSLSDFSAPDIKKLFLKLIAPISTVVIFSQLKNRGQSGRQTKIRESAFRYLEQGIQTVAKAESMRLQGEDSYPLHTYDEALNLFSLAAKRFALIGDDKMEGMAYLEMGKVYTETCAICEYDITQAMLAIDRYEAAITLFERTSNVEGIAAVYFWTGRTLQELQMYEEAIKEFDICIKIGKKNPSTLRESLMAYYYKGQSLMSLGMFNEAIHEFGQGAMAFGVMGRRIQEFRMMEGWAEATLKSGNPLKAAQIFAMAARRAASEGQLLETVQILEKQALALEASQRYTEAIAIYTNLIELGITVLSENVQSLSETNFNRKQIDDANKQIMTMTSNASDRIRILRNKFQSKETGRRFIIFGDHEDTEQILKQSIDATKLVQDILAGSKEAEFELERFFGNKVMEQLHHQEGPAFEVLKSMLNRGTLAKLIFYAREKTAAESNMRRRPEDTDGPFRGKK